MPIQTLSYSKISTFKRCSALYYYTYLHEPRLPRSENTGAMLGNVVHEVVEVLGNLNKKWYSLTQEIIKDGVLPKSVVRLIKIKLKRLDILNDEFLEKAIRFIVYCLEANFWFEGCEKILQPELDFDIKTDTLYIKGFLDRSALYRDEDGDLYAVIWDAKSSKVLFSKTDMDDSIQAMAYLMAIKTIHPEINLLKSRVDFIMAAHYEIQTFKLKDINQYNDFISMMESYQVKVDDFNKGKIKSNLAWAGGFPKDGTFSGRLMCGIGVNYSNELKKDGVTPKYYCSFRFPFSYYIGIDETGKEVYRNKEKPDKKKFPNLKVERRYFGGCCAFNNEKLVNKAGKGLEL